MPRFLPILCLVLFAAVAVPASATATSDEPSAKPGKTSAATAAQDGDPAAIVHAAPTPTRSIMPRTPRWHSLLPGMIR